MSAALVFLDSPGAQALRGLEMLRGMAEDVGPWPEGPVMRRFLAAGCYRATECGFLNLDQRAEAARLYGDIAARCDALTPERMATAGTPAPVIDLAAHRVRRGAP